MNQSAFDEFKWRGLIYDHTEGAADLLASQKITVYNGFDATADSLHIGHLVPLLALARLQRFGHHPIAVAGGGTTMVGDPGGRTTERTLMTRERIEANLVSIKKQLAHFLDFDSKTNPAQLVNNADWLLKLNLIDFLRDIGKHFTINTMITKESVRTRLEREEGISFTEFSYMLMQSYDFLHLYQTINCLMQTGGSDQWGNITAGVELIRRVTGQSVQAMVYPLITKADGSKFGKTEAGSVWLDPEQTSPYRFYQYFLNTDDRDVIHYFKVFTFLTQAEIQEMEAALVERPELREAHRRLAQELTLTVHGPSALARVEQAAQVLFGGELNWLTAAEIEDIFAEVPSSKLPKHSLEGGLALVELLAASGFTKSKGEARRAITEGGVYLNNHRVEEVGQTVSPGDLLAGRFLVLRRGKKTYHLVKVAG